MSDQIKECWSADEEMYNCDSLGELIDSNDHLIVGSIVHVGEAEMPESRQLINADDIVEIMSERAYDIGGEYAEGYPDVDDAAMSELDILLAAWIGKHCNPTFYTVENSKPYTITADDLQTETSAGAV